MQESTTNQTRSSATLLNLTAWPGTTTRKRELVQLSWHYIISMRWRHERSDFSRANSTFVRSRLGCTPPCTASLEVSISLAAVPFLPVVLGFDLTMQSALRLASPRKASCPLDALQALERIRRHGRSGGCRLGRLHGRVHCLTIVWRRRWRRGWMDRAGGGHRRSAR